MKMGEIGKIGVAEIRRKEMCDPSQACTQENQSNTTDPASDSRRDSEDPEKSWFMCKTDMDMAELHSNISSSGICLRLSHASDVSMGMLVCPSLLSD